MNFATTARADPLAVCFDKGFEAAEPVIESALTFGNPLATHANPALIVDDPRTTAEDATH